MRAALHGVRRRVQATRRCAIVGGAAGLAALVLALRARRSTVTLGSLAAERGVALPLRDASIAVRKAARRLDLLSGATRVATFRIALGPSPVGPKRREGDGRTPEGELRVVTRNPRSRYRKFLGLSYPRPSDLAASQLAVDDLDREAIVRAAHDGTAPPWTTPLGGAVGIHGRGAAFDWTAGCIAVDDDVIDVLWDVVPLGTRVVVTP